MHISRLYIRNFRNFRELDVSLSDGATCLIGENNSGKSNLLHAVRLAVDASMANHARMLDEHDFHTGVEFFAQPNQVIISVDFTDFAGKPEEEALVACWEVEDNRSRLTFRFRPKPAVCEAIAANKRPASGLTLDDYRYEWSGGGGVDPKDLKWSERGGDGVRFSDLQQFQVSYLGALRDVEQELRRRRVSPLQLMLDVMEIQEADRQAVVDSIVKANNEVRKSKVVKTLADDISKAFKKAVGKTFGLKVGLGMSDPSFASVAHSLRILLSDGDLQEFNATRNGLGLNNVLYISMLLAYFKKRQLKQDKPGEILLVEEPEAHLHPHLQRILYRTLCQQDVQSIVTTHSTHVSSGASLDSVVALSRQPNGDTTGANLRSGAKLSPAESDDVERYLDATRSTLLFAKRVLLVEGAAELFVVPPLVKQVLDVDFAELGISVVSIHGKHFSPYARLFSCDALQKRCAILCDGDDETTSPEDGGEDVPGSEDLHSLGSELVRVFVCDRTFEISLTLPGTLKMLACALDDCDSPGRAKKIREAEKALSKSSDPAERSKILAATAEVVLKGADKIGKGRFAQATARHTGRATELPEYLEKAVLWLTTD